MSIPATEDAYRCPDFWPIGKDEDTLERVALDMLGEIEVCELDNNGWWHHYYDFRDRLKALGVSVDA